MTDLLHDIDAPSDAELISRVRGGDVAAYGELFSRHVDAARRLARQLVRGPDADDLVSDAFAKVLGVLQGGGGPDVAFRAYLLTAVRRLHVDKIRAGSKLQTSDDMEAFDAGVPFQDTAVAAFESGAAAKAFASLPERWQLVLWHLEVEGQKPADIAPLLGMSANSVSALAYRAREGLRQAFLTMHLNDTSDTSCRWVNEHLGAYVRNGLAKRDATKVQSHLDECRRCTAMYLELTEVNSNLRGIIAPLLLGAAAAGYLSSTGAAAGGGFGLVAFFGRARDAVSANAGAATAGAVAAGVAAVATAGIMLLPSSGPEDTVTGADDPIGAVTTPGVPDRDAGPGEDSDGPAGAEDDGVDVAGDDGTAASEEPTLDATPEAVPVSDAGTESTADGGTGSETDGGDQTGGGDNPGGEPTGGPTGGPTDGPTEGPTDGPTDSPTDGPTSGPTEGPTGGPTSGPTSGPTGNPTTTPTGEPTPTPTEEPTNPPVQYTIQVTALQVEDGRVSFDFDGVLPPVVYLSITSEPATVLFTDDGTCDVDAAGVTASCDLAGTQTLLAPLARIAAAVTEEPFLSDASVGLTRPTEDSNVTIAMAALPDGPALATETFQVKAPTMPTADVSLDLPATIVATEALDYTVPVTVAGVPSGYEGPLTFHLTSVPPSEATFVGDALCEVRDDGSTLVCSEAPTSFKVRVKNNNDPTSVTITLDPLAGIADPVDGNNTDTVVLEAFRPALDASVSVTSAPQGNSGMATLTVDVSSSEATVPVTLAGVFDPAYLDGTDVLPENCKVVEGTGLECSVTGNRTFTLPVDVARVQNNARFEDFVFTVAVPDTHVDPDPDDNTDSVLVERFGSSLVDSGGTEDAGSTTTHSTTDGLQPTAPTSPVARTLEATAETLTSLAQDVTRAEERESQSTKSTREATEPARTTETGRTGKALDDKAPRPPRVKPDKKTSDPAATSPAADKRNADPTDRKASAEERSADRSERKAGGPDKADDASSPPASQSPTSEDDGLVDTVVKAVKKIL